MHYSLKHGIIQQQIVHWVAQELVPGQQIYCISDQYHCQELQHHHNVAHGWQHHSHLLQLLLQLRQEWVHLGHQTHMTTTDNGICKLLVVNTCVSVC